MAAWCLPGRWPDGGRRSTVATWTPRRAAPAYAPIHDLTWFFQIKETWHQVYRGSFFKQALKRAQECKRGFYHYQSGFSDTGVRNKRPDFFSFFGYYCSIRQSFPRFYVVWGPLMSSTRRKVQYRVRTFQGDKPGLLINCEMSKQFDLRK